MCLEYASVCIILISRNIKMLIKTWSCTSNTIYRPCKKVQISWKWKVFHHLHSPCRFKPYDFLSSMPHRRRTYKCWWGFLSLKESEWWPGAVELKKIETYHKIVRMTHTSPFVLDERKTFILVWDDMGSEWRLYFIWKVPLMVEN